ncbi:MAG: FAD-binding protein, partial [Coriobacteriaceae bacterium]|nr:FAD-binding protein [Coriobacteriaceae bacterium]
VENYYKFLVAAGGPGVSEDHCRVLADKSLDLHDWLVNTLGVVFKPGYNPPWPQEANYEAGLACTGDEYNRDYEGIAEAVPHSHWVEGFETGEGVLTGSKNGSGFFQPLKNAVEALGPEVFYETRARQLVMDASGRVVGVVASEKGKEVTIKASKAVILSTGGFAKNEEMVHQYCPYADGSFVIGTPGDMGDGIRMGQGVGADTRHMNFAYGQLSTSTWMYRHSVVGGPLISGILVNQRGLRFISEDHYSGSYYAQVVRNPYYYTDYNPFYMVYDSAILEEMLPIAEVKPENVVATGNTVAELAESLGMPKGSLEATLEYYNKYASEGEDPVWKKAAQWVKPIATPPFYAMKATTLNGLFTFGGLKINTDAQVIHALTQKPIPGLYSAGRNASDIFGTGYQASGASIASCYTFGRIAGAKAAAETPWDA